MSHCIKPCLTTWSCCSLCYVTAKTCPLAGDSYWILPNTLGMWLTSWPWLAFSLGTFYKSWFHLTFSSFLTMEFVTNINDQLDMANAGCFKSDEPWNSQFLLLFGDREKPCPKFYGKVEDKKKVYHALKEDIHHEVQTKWGHVQCHCQQLPR